MYRQCIFTLGPIYTKRSGSKNEKDQRINDKHQRKFSLLHSLFNDVNGPLNVFCRFRFKADYVQAVDGMKKHLLRYTEPSRLAFMGALSSVNSRSFRAEMVSISQD